MLKTIGYALFGAFAFASVSVIFTLHIGFETLVIAIVGGMIGASANRIE